MVVLLVAGLVLLPEYRADSSTTVDLTSAALSLAAVLAVVYGLKEAAAGTDLLLPALAVSAGGLLAVAFARRQRRLPQPLLDLSLFRQRSFSVAIGVLTLGSVVLAGVGFLTAQYLQLVLGLSPLAAGLWTLPPLAAGIAAVGLVQTFGQRLTVAASTAAGLMGAAGGLAVLTQAPANGVAVVVTGLALLVAGLMPVLAQGVDTVTASAPPDRAGAASALSETAQELGGALGIAALGSLTTAVYRTQISELLQGVPPPIADTARDTLAGALSVASDLPATVLSGAAIAFTDGLHTASAAGAVVLVVVAALAAVVLRPRPQPHTHHSGREA
jgi:DHA2 family multidrug resistance protein-like MFS transporter